ncbi:MAG: HNH endonuclease domain-containing protein [Sphaerochaetaceae bacterium]|jgi:hypothetical protein|nr:hypothetical protein [Spirochaetales bacterium]
MNYQFNEQLPDSKLVDKNILLQLFKDITNSYKYLFFMGLLKLLKRENFNKLTFSLEDIGYQMLALAYYPYKVFKLSFGLQDQICNELDNQKLTEDEEVLTFNPDKLIKRFKASSIEVNSFLKYVPYRLIRPFFQQELRGKRDQEVNRLISKLAKEEFMTRHPLYYIDEDNNKLIIHPGWVSYFSDNHELVLAFAKWEYLRYMQRNNPSVPNVQYKLFPEEKRQSLTKETNFWTEVLKKEELFCIYSHQRITPENFSLDHFIPWSFVVHNQLWNLIPTLKSVNSSKSNNLPSINRYFDNYAQLQHKGLTLFKTGATPSSWNKAIEPYLLDLRIEEYKISNYDYFKDKLKATVLPLITIAENQGFSNEWVYGS